MCRNFLFNISKEILFSKFIASYSQNGYIHIGHSPIYICKELTPLQSHLNWQLPVYFHLNSQRRTRTLYDVTRV